MLIKTSKNYRGSYEYYDLEMNRLVQPAALYGKCPNMDESLTSEIIFLLTNAIQK